MLGAPQSTRLPTWMFFQPWPLPVASARLISALLCTIGDDLPCFKTTDAPDTMPSLLILDFQKPSGSAPPGPGPELYSHNCAACLCPSYYWFLPGLEKPTLLFPCSSLAEVLPKVSCLGSHHTVLSVSSHILLAGVSSTEVLQGQR